MIDISKTYIEQGKFHLFFNSKLSLGNW